MPGPLREAAADLRYLLSKGYRRSSAVRFVADRYRLSRADRLALYRCVYPTDAAESHFRKVVPAEDLRGAVMSIDGFNVLRTVHAALHGHPLYLSDDGFVRDISIGLRKPTFGDLVECLGLVVPCICDLKPSLSVFVYDRPVSRSGELSKKTLDLMRAMGVPGTSKTSMRSDTEILTSGEVVATSDSVVIERASKCFDLGGYVVSAVLKSPPTKI
ncbi:MAG: DUF434 domain-containing protein [Candidatus Methanosuratincola petrocarbonis]